MANFNLPDIQFAQKDAQIIESEIVQEYEQTVNQSLTDADPRKKLLQSEVPIIVGQRSMINYSAKQNLLAYASGEFLDHIGILVGCTRIPATAATATVRFTLSKVRTLNTVISSGKRVTAGDNIYFTTISETVIPSGSLIADVKVESMTLGRTGNGYEAGTLITLVDPIPYIAAVSNITASEGGMDAESDDAFRERIRQAPESFSTAGPSGAYEYWAKTASSLIIDVSVYSPSPGVVSICPLVSGGEIPGQEILDSVSVICNDKKIRPLTDQVQVIPPTPIQYNIDVSFWIDRQNENIASNIRTKVESAVNEYILWQKSKLGRSIDPSELVYRMKDAGAKRVSVTTPIYQILEGNQVAKEQDTIINYGGIES